MVPLTPPAGLWSALSEGYGQWHPLPFEGQRGAWEAAHPEAFAWLDAVVSDDLERPDWAERPGVPALFTTWARRLAALSALPAPPAQAAPRWSLPERQARGLPGRKRAQALAFAAALPAPWHDTQPIDLLDWCGGKAWLGLGLLHARAQPQDRLHVLDHDDALLTQALERAYQLGVHAHSYPLDARSLGAAAQLTAARSVVALHACGDLHGALIDAVRAYRPARVALAPCCYNRIEAPEAALRSAWGQSAQLTLTRSDLSLLHRQAVVAGEGERRRAQRQQAWRLGFEAWRAQATQDLRYQPLPAWPHAIFERSFVDFCRFAWAALAAEGVALPEAPGDPTPFEAEAWRRLGWVRRREAVRGLFRPALEVALVYDRALLLQAAGYAVRVVRFCEAPLSPRNALILAERVPQAAPCAP